ncbi:MAG: hypothetical protein OEZ31_09005 [Nitrospirota bacterium]|nr:hypothetical protein [Nitrospirota bacterium]MDH5769080.1 hypothetical protein [Nitrospirota bacterium]
MDIDIKEIKEVAKKYSPEQIESCITQQVETGENICLEDGVSEKIINELAKAKVVRSFIENGMSLADALRELARKMRLVQKGFEGEEK